MHLTRHPLAVWTLGAACAFLSGACDGYTSDCGDGFERVLWVLAPERGGANPASDARQYATIGDAVRAARGRRHTTVVCLDEGVYYERLWLPGGVALRGTGRGRTVLSDPAIGREDPMIEVDLSNGERVTLRDLSLVSDGLAISARGGGLELVEVEIRDAQTGVSAEGSEVRTTRVRFEDVAFGVRGTGGSFTAAETRFRGGSRDLDWIGGTVDLEGVQLSGRGRMTNTGPSLELQGVELNARRLDVLDDLELPGRTSLVDLYECTGRWDAGRLEGEDTLLRSVVQTDLEPLELSNLAVVQNGGNAATFQVLDGFLHLTHVTVIGSEAAPAFDLGDAGSVRIRNSIAWHHAAALRRPGNSNRLDLDFTMTPAGWPGGIETDDPSFESAPRDLRLTEDSPAIDAGSPDWGIDHDLEGQPRPQGDGYDLGAYERR
jgi:hypothetical protein